MFIRMPTKSASEDARRGIILGSRSYKWSQDVLRMSPQTFSYLLVRKVLLVLVPCYDYIAAEWFCVGYCLLNPSVGQN